MATLNVQFSDSTQATVISYFGCPQDPAVYPNLGTLDTTDARWKSYYKTAYPNGAPFFCNMPAPPAD